MAIPNALFAVFAVTSADAVEAKLQSIAPWLSLKVGLGEWLIVAPTATTTKEVCERIGLGVSDPVSSGIVVRSEGYFGRAATSIWEWIATKTGAELGPSAPA